MGMDFGGEVRKWVWVQREGWKMGIDFRGEVGKWARILGGRLENGYGF